MKSLQTVLETLGGDEGKEGLRLRLEEVLSRGYQSLGEHRSPTPVQIKRVTFLVAQKNLITFLKKRVILMRDLFATNRRKSNFLHE